ncbi:MAG: transporter substrate-binding domain-containing protein [Ruminococcaceae bacterium]|nr:transporter substrate-binding domain-containing protein [Oscillospiraceae bacterium]
MKKLLALLLAALMLLACTACGDTTAVKVIDIDLSEELYAFGVDKDQPELLAKANELIKEIKENGKFDEICNKYFGDGTPTPVTSAALDESKDQLVVVTNAEFAPFEYKQGDQYLGIDMEIADLLAKKLDKELVILNVAFEAVCLNVGQKKADIAMAGLTISEDRTKHVTFTDSYYTASQRLIVKGDDTTFDECKTLEDVEKILNGFGADVKVGVQNGTTGESYCAGSEDMGFAGLKVTAKGYANGALATQDMINGNLDYVIIDAAPAATIAASFNK